MLSLRRGGHESEFHRVIHRPPVCDGRDPVGTGHSGAHDCRTLQAAVSPSATRAGVHLPLDLCHGLFVHAHQHSRFLSATRAPCARPSLPCHISVPLHLCFYRGSTRCPSVVILSSSPRVRRHHLVQVLIMPLAAACRRKPSCATVSRTPQQFGPHFPPLLVTTTAAAAVVEGGEAHGGSNSRALVDGADGRQRLKYIVVCVCDVSQNDCEYNFNGGHLRVSKKSPPILSW